MNVLKARGGILLLGALLAACNGGHGTLPVAPGSSATGQGARSAGGLVYGGNLLAGATYLGPAALKTVGFDVWPALRDGRGLIEYAAHASDPASTHYRHWLTATQIGERFGAPASDYAALVKYLNGYGIAVKSYPQRMMLRVRGPQSGVEQALGMKLGFYRKGTQTFLAPQSAPNVPAGFHVAGFTALVGYRFQTRDYVPVRAASGILQGYAPQQLANAFDYVGAYQAAGHYTGSGITIGIIGTGPITDGDPRIGLGDVAEYRAIFGVSGSGAVTQVYDLTSVSAGNPSVVGGQYSSGLATPPPVTNPASSACAAQGINGPASGTPTDYTTCNPEDVEAQLDTEQASALAPDANLRFYIAYNPNECFATGTYTPNPVTGPVTCPGIGGTPTQQLGIALADDEIQSAIADGSADIVSLSYGLAEADALGFYYDASGNGFGPTEFAALAAQGVAIFVSSGDNGAQGCATSSAQPNPDALCVSYPATDPSVVSAGGVNTPLDSAGHLTGPITGWGQQTENPASPGGSGGGCSLTFEAPAYEAGLSPADPCAGKRSQPDASLDADLNTGVATVVDADPSLGGRLVAAVGGTSVAAPEMAAMWALVLQACKAAPSCGNGPGAYPYRLGNPNYYYYPIYRAGTSGAIPPGGKKFTPALPYSQVFYDVLYGANGLPSQSGSGFAPGFSAGPGLDLVTGLGAPYGRNLIHAVTGI